MKILPYMFGNVYGSDANMIIKSVYSSSHCLAKHNVFVVGGGGGGGGGQGSNILSVMYFGRHGWYDDMPSAHDLSLTCHGFFHHLLAKWPVMC